ncbi:MAG: class I SAM-dependent methyltransferase [FCB group bacterium]
MPNIRIISHREGSGSAWVAEKLCKDGLEIISLDISFANVKKALETYKSEHHFGVVGDGLKVPFKEKSFDCIIASEVIEHTVEPQLFIAELKGLLKEGGVLIISTPYKEELQYSICIHCNQPTPKNAHLHSFDENKLIQYFEQKDRKQVKHYIFGNKALLVLRTYTILQFLPIGLWKFIDRIASFIMNRKNHIIIKYQNNDKK